MVRRETLHAVIEGEFTEVKPIERPYRMNGVFPPVGTIVGPSPKALEFMTVTAHDENGVTLRTANRHDFTNASVRMPWNGPHSVTEHKILQVINTIFGPARQIV